MIGEWDMNTNFYLVEVIQNEKMEEIREVNEKGRLIKLIPKKGTETKINPALIAEKQFSSEPG